MLSVLLLASTTGQPLPREAVARCTRPPVDALTFVPTTATTWRSNAGHVLLAAWADRADRWHVGEHGITLTTGTPWPLASRFTAPSGVAFELTDRLGPGADAGAVGWLTGATTIVRLHPDGTGLVAAPSTGGGAVHVATGDGLVAISDRVGIAAAGVGGAPRSTDLAALTLGCLRGTATGIRGVERLRPGGHVRLDGRHPPVVTHGRSPWGPSTGTLAEAADAAADDLVRLVELAATTPGSRVLELGDDSGSLVLAAAVRAAGVVDAFTVRAAVEGQALDSLRTLLDTPLAPPVAHAAGGEALDDRLRTAVARTAAGVAIRTGHSGRLTGVSDDADVRVATMADGPLRAATQADVVDLVRSGAAAALVEDARTWRSDRVPAGASEAEVVVHEALDVQLPRSLRAAADLDGRARLLDPLAVPSIARLALTAAREGVDAVPALLAALHPPAATQPLDGTAATPRRAAPWRELGPLLEAHVLGYASGALATTFDLDAIRAVVRTGVVPAPDVVARLEGALTAAIWAGETDLHRPAVPVVVDTPGEVDLAGTVPTLVTGVTSRSLLELAGVDVPLSSVDVDAMLGVRVDREVRDLAVRVLLAAGAAPGHLPPDLDDRLAGPATAHLGAAARSLLVRRGGTLVDARLALTLPFWHAHVARPRVVLVAERPPDLAARSPAALPLEELLGWWVDAMTAAADARADIRVVDPGDLAGTPDEEASGWDGLHDGGPVEDTLRVARTVDSLVREVELEAARPLLRTIRRARAEQLPVPHAASAPAAAPLHVVDELWERAAEADRRLSVQRSSAEELEDRLAALTDEVDRLRGRSGLRAAWDTLRGRP